LARGRGKPADTTGAYIGADALSYDVFELVSFVDYERPVRRKHRSTAAEISSELVKVDYHYVCLLRFGPGAFGKAVGARRAAMSSGTLVGADTDG
jgi:hypothetical protein